MTKGKTQNERLLVLLRERGEVGVTPMEAFASVGTMRLAARIADLRAAGYDIVTTKRDTRQRYATYVLRRPYASYALSMNAKPSLPEKSELELRYEWGDR